MERERVFGFLIFLIGLSVFGFFMIGVIGIGFGLILGFIGIIVWIGVGLIRLVVIGKIGVGMMGGYFLKNGKFGFLFG